MESSIKSIGRRSYKTSYFSSGLVLLRNEKFCFLTNNNPFEEEEMRNALIGIFLALALIVGAIVVSNITAASRAAKRGAEGAQEYISTHRGELQGPQGLPGLNGLDGKDGVAGKDGINCWDLDGNGSADLWEDTNGDGFVDVNDCRGIYCAVGDEVNCQKPPVVAKIEPGKGKPSQPGKGGKKGGGGKPQPDGKKAEVAVEQTVTVNINGELAKTETDDEPDIGQIIGIVNGSNNKFFVTSVRVR